MNFAALMALAAAAAPVVFAQPSPPLSAYTEPASGVTIKLAIPEVETGPFPILMSIVAPASVTWVGWAAGACMLRSPLIVAWPKANNAGIQVVTRWAKEYHPPTPYPNTTLTTYTTSSANATHWTANLLCAKGCSEWYGGDIDPNNNNATFGFGMSSQPVAQPNNVNTAIRYHNLAKGHYAIDLTAAKRADFDQLVAQAGTSGL